MINLLHNADDMVLIAPLGHALQCLIVYNCALAINMSFNTSKTVCMVFNPAVSSKVVNRWDFSSHHSQLMEVN